MNEEWKKCAECGCGDCERRFDTELKIWLCRKCQQNKKTKKE
jgi:hypothetical protein